MLCATVFVLLLHSDQLLVLLALFPAHTVSSLCHWQCCNKYLNYSIQILDHCV